MATAKKNDGTPDQKAAAAAPESATSDAARAPFKPIETNHTPWAFDTRHSEEGGHENGVVQTSGDDLAADEKKSDAEADAESK